MHAKSCRCSLPRSRTADSIAYGDAILAHLGGAPIDTVLLVSEDCLVASKAATALDELMASFGQLGAHRWRDPRFHLHQTHPARRLPRDLGAADMAEAHEVACFLRIHSEIDHVHQNLCMALRLH